MAKANKTTMDAEIQAFAQDVRQSIAQARQGEAAHVHTPADIARYVLAMGAGGAEISPDGKSIAFNWRITGLFKMVD